MYDRRLTQTQLNAVSRQQGWDLEEHSIAEIERATSHLDGIYDHELKQLRRPLHPEETRFIQNERKLCALDFHYWSSRYAWIIDWRKNEVRFTPNVAQRMVAEVWADLERRNLAIMMVELKARQLGVTTYSAIAVTHRVQFRARTNAVVASADPKKTLEMGKMIRFIWDRQPWWLMPRPTKFEKFMPVEFGEIDSSILVQAGNQFNGVARGQTPNVGLLSELSSWQNAENDVDASLLKAVHPTPDVFMIFESTALGRDNWWHDNWQRVKIDWPRGRSFMCPLFLPWFVGTDIWPTETDLRARPIPVDWTPQDRTIAHADRAREYVLANDLLFKHLAKSNKDWTLPREQMWFYEIERETAIAKKQLNTFLSEMPANDLEAFQNTNISVIDQDVLMTYRDRVRHPLAVFAIVGPHIHQSLLPSRSQWDLSVPPIRVPVAGVCRSDDIYNFVKLKFDGYPGYDPSFKLFIYEWPENNEIYGLGVDTSDGIGEDASSIEGLRKASDDRGHGQVCEFTSPYVKADQLWPMALAIAAFYSTYQARTQRRMQCRVAVECRGNGEIVQREMQKRGWANFHPWKKYDNRRPTRNSEVAKIGVFTNVWFRTMMMDKLLTAVDEDFITIGSPWLVNELETLERDPEQTSARAAYGAHDDRAMSIGFILFSLTVDDLPSEQRRRRLPTYLPDAVNEFEALQVHPTWQPPAHATDHGFAVVQRFAPKLQRKFGALQRPINGRMPRGFR